MPGRPLAAALACAAAAVTVHAVALGTDAGGRVDAAILGALAGRGGAAAAALGAEVARFLAPVPFALLGAALVCLAVARARPREAVVVAGVLAGAAVTSQLLKAGLAAPRPHPTPAAAPIAVAAWPSGHTTGAAALALCAALVAPPRLRRPAIAGAVVLVALVGLALVVQPSHWPSDVLGGVCVAGAWCSLGVAALCAAPPLPARTVRTGAAGLALGGLVAAAALALARPGSALHLVEAHTTAAAPAALLAAGGGPPGGGGPPPRASRGGGGPPPGPPPG